MKFSFDKIKTEEEPKPENAELTQEQFDEQIIQEADKLNTNLEQLKAEIDSFGGVDKFKERFESDVNGSNVAERTLSELSFEEQRAKQDAKKKAIWGTVFALSTVLTELGMIKFTPSGGPEWIFIFNMVASLTVGGGVAINRFIESAKDRARARKASHDKKTKELEFKMTGTEVK